MKGDIQDVVSSISTQNVLGMWDVCESKETTSCTFFKYWVKTYYELQNNEAELSRAFCKYYGQESNANWNTLNWHSRATTKGKLE